MLTVLKNLHPVARKEHRCNFCHCIIPAGERYSRQSLVYDGHTYDWIGHEDCVTVSHILDMYDKVDEGLDDSAFQEFLYEYIQDNYQDKDLDDIPDNIAKMSLIERVRMVLADWDTPKFKIPRLKSDISEYEQKEKYYNIVLKKPNEFVTRYLEKLRKELKELEENEGA